MRVAVIPVVVGALRSVPKNQEKRLDELDIRGRIETTHTTTLLKSARLLRKGLETREDWLSLIVQ